MHDYINALIGGSLIGVAAVLLMATEGAILGVSGIASRAIKQPFQGSAWRFSFLIGLVAAPLLLSTLSPVNTQITVTNNSSLLIVGGLLVGFGTVVGNGCTSGHGVCGMSRLSPRSLLATGLFMITAIMTVVVMNTIGGHTA